MTVTLDKWMTKLVLGAQGIDTPRARLVVPRRCAQAAATSGHAGVGLSGSGQAQLRRVLQGHRRTMRWPAILALWPDMLPKALRRYPRVRLIRPEGESSGRRGTDVTVPFLEARVTKACCCRSTTSSNRQPAVAFQHL